MNEEQQQLATDRHHEHNGRTDRLINLNKIEMIIGIIAGLVAVFSAFGTWYILPYRMAQNEVSIAEVRAQVV